MLHAFHGAIYRALSEHVPINTYVGFLQPDSLAVVTVAVVVQILTCNSICLAKI